jgi:BON domain
MAEERMYQGNSFSKFSMASVFMAGLVLCSGAAFAQTKPAGMPDAQVEANVLKALAGAPELADQSITSTTVYGTVTLNGTVRDEASRDLAEHLVANTAGVQKVVDQLAIGTPAPASDDSQQAGTNPNLQSDGTIAPPQGQDPPAQTSPSPTGAPQNGAPAPPQQGQYPPQPNGGAPRGQYPPQQAGPYPPPPYNRPPYGQPYPPQTPQQPHVAQKGGDAVVIPSGSTIRVRINQGMSSKNTAPGTTFDGVVLGDVVAGGSIAIPRGASITGTVVDAHTAGQLGGKGELKLQLTSVSFGGRTYPVVTDFWWHQGVDKTGNTVGTTVGLASVGALIGAVAGGGVGAAVGAGVGGVAGLGVSSASGKGEAGIPPEAIVTFHLTKPADVTTVSQAELNRLGAGVPPSQQQPQMQRRYPPPPPPPGYYPYPYPYPYYGPVYYYPR